MERRPVAGELYRHFKNKLYQIVTVAQHSETKEELVIYQALYGEYRTYARPLEMFISEVDHEKYPDVTQKYRFEKVEREKVTAQTDALKGVANEGVLECRYSKFVMPESTEGKMMAFFDTEDLDLRYKILLEMREEITNTMIDNMAVVMDIVVPDGDLITRYDNLKRAISTRQRYEQNMRLR